MSPAFFQLVTRYQFVAVAALSLGALFVSPEIAMGSIAGGVVMAFNFWAMRVLLHKAVGLGGAKPSMKYALLLIAKFGFVLAAMFILVNVFELNVIGIALGLFTLFVGMGLAMLHGLFVARPSNSTDS